MRLAIAVAFLSIWTQTTSAQSPRAGGPAAGDSKGEDLIAAEANIGGNVARGFVDRELITARGIVQGWTGPWGLYIQPYWLYGRIGTPAGKITTDNEIYVRTGAFRKFEGTTLFAYAVSVYDRSVRRKIAYRDLTGAGFGINLLEDKAVNLLMSFGVLGEITNFRDPTLQDPDGPGTFEADKRRWTARWSGRIYGRYRLASGKFSLTHDLIVVPSFTDPRDDYRVLFFAGIEAPIAKGFSVRMQADATYEGLIVVGTKHDDLAITFSVAYKNEWKRTKPPASPSPTSPSPASPSPASPSPASPSPASPSPAPPSPASPSPAPPSPASPSFTEARGHRR